MCDRRRHSRQRASPACDWHGYKNAGIAGDANDPRSVGNLGGVGIILGPVIGALFIAIWELWGAAMIDAQAGGQFEVNGDERTSKNIK